MIQFAGSLLKIPDVKTEQFANEWKRRGSNLQLKLQSQHEKCTNLAAFYMNGNTESIRDIGFHEKSSEIEWKFVRFYVDTNSFISVQVTMRGG
jgi:hypothetical protein